MDKQPKELYEDKVNAGRGVAKDLDTSSDSVSIEDKSKVQGTASRITMRIDENENLWGPFVIEVRVW